MKKSSQGNYTKHYLNSKRRGKSKPKDNSGGPVNYRTSTSSCSNHSYLNNSMINSNKGAAYTDVFLSQIGKDSSSKPSENKKVLPLPSLFPYFHFVIKKLVICE